ncbi:MAG: hypothetical protein JWQ43_4190 [Glaciihabitans sp.]|nr:hypothetical protein [Glaciihabitans sp.]
MYRHLTEEPERWIGVMWAVRGRGNTTRLGDVAGQV